jgi:hypothetical protein
MRTDDGRDREGYLPVSILLTRYNAMVNIIYYECIINILKSNLSGTSPEKEVV